MGAGTSNSFNKVSFDYVEQNYISKERVKEAIIRLIPYPGCRFLLMELGLQRDE